MRYVRGIILMFAGFGMILGALLPEVQGYVNGIGVGLLLVMASEEISKDYTEDSK